MLCFIRPIIENNLFEIQIDNTCYLNVLDENEKINIKLLITAISSIYDTYDKLCITFNKNLKSTEILKIMLMVNYFEKITYFTYFNN